MVALAPGQSFSHTYTSTYTQTAPLPAPAAQVYSVRVTQTFLGFETVTVPAGTFVDACKFLKLTTLGVERRAKRPSGVLAEASCS